MFTLLNKWCKSFCNFKKALRHLEVSCKKMQLTLSTYQEFTEIKSSYIEKYDFPLCTGANKQPASQSSLREGLSSYLFARLAGMPCCWLIYICRTSFPSFPFLTLRSILVGILKRGRSTAFSANLHSVEILRLASKKGGISRKYFCSDPFSKSGLNTA